MEIRSGTTMEKTSASVAQAFAFSRSCRPMATDAQEAPPMLIRQPSMAKRKEKELTMFIEVSASRPSIRPARMLLAKLAAVVPRSVRIVGTRYFRSIFLIK